MMNKKIIIIISAILVVAIIGVGIYFVYQQKANNIDLTNQTDNKPIENNKDVFSLINKLNCDDIVDIKEKENCLAGVIKILNSDDSSVCNNLIFEDDQKSCQQAYIIKDVVRSDDLSKCDAITDNDLSADCTSQASFSLAIKKNDGKYCKNIVNEIDKQNCFNTISDMNMIDENEIYADEDL